MATDKRFLAKNGLDNNNNTITNVSDPVNPQDVATRNFSSNASNITSGTLNAARLPSSISATITGNASTATALQTARTITLDGDVSGSASFDGTSNITITTAVSNNSHDHTSIISGTTSASVDSDSFDVAVGGSTRLIVNSSGNLGLGETVPTSKLHIKGAGGLAANIQIESTTNSDGRLTFKNTLGEYSIGVTGAPTGDWLHYDNINSHIIHDYRAGASGYHRFWTNNSERMRITSTGNVGIGTTPPVQQSLSVGKNVTGATLAYGIVSNGTVMSDVTTHALGVYSGINTQPTTFTLAQASSYYAETVVGAGSTVTSYFGFNMAPVSGPANIYGFKGSIAAGTNNWNLYMDGTAKNHIAGTLLIGTTTDDGVNKLQVSGATLINSSASRALRITRNGGSVANSCIDFFNGTTTWNIGVSGSNFFGINYNNAAIDSALFSINSSGNVGIGTNSPLGRLHVATSGTTDVYFQCLDTGQSRLYFGGTTTPTKGSIIYSDNSDVFGFYTNSTERMRITSAGNVLIGTTTDDGSNKLQVNGQVFASTALVTPQVASSANLILAAAGANTIQLVTNGIERVRVTSSGNVLIGTTTDDGSNKLQVSGSAVVSTSAQVPLTIQSSSTAVYLRYINSGNSAVYTGSTSSGDFDIQTAATTRARVTASGNVLVGTSTDDGVNKLQVSGSLAVGDTNVTNAGVLITRFNSSVLARIHSLIPSTNSPTYQHIFGGAWTGERAGNTDAAHAYYMAAAPAGVQFEIGRIPVSGAFTSANLSPAVVIKGVNNNVLIGTTTDDGTNKLQVSGSAIFTGNTQIGSGNTGTRVLTLIGATPRVEIDGATANDRDIRFATAGSLRWILRTEGSTESGSNAGSDFSIIRRSDAGADLGQALVIKRNTGNVLVGTTTDDGVNKLQVSGSGTFSSTLATSGELIVRGGNPGHAASRGVIAYANPNTQMWSYGPDATTQGGFQFLTRSSNGSLNATAMTLVGSTGNLLIGTTTDNGSDKLQVNGTVKFSGNGLTIDSSGASGSTSLNLTCLDTGSCTINFGGTSNSDKGRIVYDDLSNVFHFFTNDSEKMRITSGGNLLVGTTSSSGRKLQVYGAGEFKDVSGIATTIWSEAISGAGGVGTNSNHPFVILTNGAERVRVSSTGNMGIGLDSPDSTLHVRTDSATTNAPIQVANIHATTSGTAANGIGARLAFTTERATGAAATAAFIDALLTDVTNVSSALTFSTRSNAGSLTERLRIDAAGQVSVGQTNADPWALGLTRHLTVGVGSTTTASASLSVQAGTTGNARIDLGNETILRAGVRAIDGSHLTFLTNGTNTGTTTTERARITSGGNLLVGTTVDASARLNVRGVDQTASNFVFIAADSNGNSGFSVRNDRRVTVNEKLLVGGITTDDGIHTVQVAGPLSVSNGGVDATPATALTSYYSANYTERNIIQSAVSSTAANSGWYFRVSDGGGSANTTEMLRINRDAVRVYGNTTQRTPSNTDSILTVDATSTNVSQRINLSANGTIQTQIYDDATVTRFGSLISKPVTFLTNNSERMRIEANGNMLLKSSTSIPVNFSTVSSSVDPDFQLSDITSLMSLVTTQSSASGAQLTFAKYRGTTTGTLTSNDTVGIINFQGSDGTDVNNIAAEIRGEIDGTVSTNLIPGRITFATANGTVVNNLTERLRIDSSGNVRVVSNTGGLGYGAGAGGTVTQTTSKSTAVTLNRPCGKITMDAAALAAGATVTFNVFNSLVTADDVILVTPQSAVGITLTNYRIEVWYTGSGQFGMRVTNISAGSLSDALVINFAIIKGAAA